MRKEIDGILLKIGYRISGYKISSVIGHPKLQSFSSVNRSKVILSRWSRFVNPKLTQSL